MAQMRFQHVIVRFDELRQRPLFYNTKFHWLLNDFCSLIIVSDSLTLFELRHNQNLCETRLLVQNNMPWPTRH